MKVLTAAAMRDVDRRTTELGIPGIVLMENAGHRVVEFLAERFAPLSEHRIAILCGKGNNGGDGMVVARQLFTRFHPRSLYVVLLAAPEDLKGDAAVNYRMLVACGCPVAREIPAGARNASLVVDALLGTGISGPAAGPMLDAIREVNNGFPLAKVVAVDIPSGLPSDTPDPFGEYVRADHTVTFTAPKIGQVMPPNCDLVGELVVRPIGSPPSLYQDAPVELIEPAMFRALLAPRPRWGHKGTFGHVLIVGGSHGKTGAPSMSGMAALHAGAGLVTVASTEDAIPQIASHAPELMTAVLDGNVEKLAEGKTVVGIGPGLGRRPELVARVAALALPVVFDADALIDAPPPSEHSRILTPHPGEMARLSGKSTAEVQQDRLGTARAYAVAHRVTLVLKGERTLLAFSDGRIWINPTGTPALGTGGTGDILTGLISGMLAQFPQQPDQAVAAAVYLGGLAGEIGAREIGEKPFVATDILKYLPKAMEACA
jgi:ADP-dependent NAD(P)H-hydrate dehydratase / NAD(P)H-hydrate epimerase